MENHKIVLGLLAVLSISSVTLALPHHAENHTATTEKEGSSEEKEGATTEQGIDYTAVRLDPETNKYYDVSSTKPCPENMAFFAVPNHETHGRCDCNFNKCSRPLLYSNKTKQCHWAWSKGPCEKGEWYTFNGTLSPVCEPNPCPQSPDNGSIDYFFKNPEDGVCYESGTQGYCKDPNERLLITPGEPIPKCRTSTVCFPLSRPQQQECLAGNRRTYEGFC